MEIQRREAREPREHSFVLYAREMNARVAEQLKLENDLRYALRELRGGLRGFYVFIACIALGVMAIAGVGSVAASRSRWSRCRAAACRRRFKASGP